jgi:hypothetical protein
VVRPTFSVAENASSAALSKSIAQFDAMLNVLAAVVRNLSQLRRELEIIKGFYQQVPAYRLASDLKLNQKTVSRVYQHLREYLYHTAELEVGKL